MSTRSNEAVLSRDGRGYVYAVGLGAMVVAICLQLFLFSRGFYSIGWDESSRSLDAYTWAAHGRVDGRAWLPFYRICVGLGLKVFPDLFLTPRMVSFVFGLATIPAAGWLAEEIFQCRKATALTLVLAACFGQRVALSLAPLSSILFIFFMLVTMALFARWLRTDEAMVLAWCGVFGALAGTVRYEGWVFAAALFVIAASRDRSTWEGARRNYLLLFGGILFCFPVACVVMTFRASNPMDVVIADARGFSALEIVRRNPLVTFVVTNALSLNLIGMIGVVQLALGRGWRAKAMVAAAFAPLVGVAVILLMMRSAQTGPAWRDAAVWGMFLLPFTAHVLVGDWWRFAGRRSGKMLAAIAAGVMLSAFLCDAFAIKRSSSWAFPKSDRLAGEYLNGLIATHPDGKILIESSTFAFLNIEVASQHPDLFVLNSVPERPSVAVLQLGELHRDALERRGIAFLVFRGDDYKEFLDRSAGVEKLSVFGAWSVYAVQP